MNIREKVLGVLLLSPKGYSPKEVILKGHSLSAEEIATMLEEARAVVEKNPEKSWEVVSRISAYQTTSNLFGKPEKNILLLLHAQEASLGDQESLCFLEEALLEASREIKHFILMEKQKNLVGSWDSAMNFLFQITGPDTAPFLADSTGVSVSAARRWLSGKQANPRNTFHVRAVVKSLYFLSEDQLWGEERTKEWLYKPLPSGGSPRQLWRQESIPSELLQEFRRVGLIPG